MAKTKYTGAARRPLLKGPAGQAKVRKTKAQPFRIQSTTDVVLKGRAAKSKTRRDFLKRDRGPGRAASKAGKHVVDNLLPEVERKAERWTGFYTRILRQMDAHPGLYGGNDEEGLPDSVRQRRDEYIDERDFHRFQLKDYRDHRVDHAKLVRNKKAMGAF